MSIEMITGKWYVCDADTTDPVAGPFDSESEADEERDSADEPEDFVVIQLED